MNSSKVCTKCKAEKSLHEFHRDSNGALGRKSSCKSCVKEKDRLWHLKNRDKNLRMRKEYRLAHLEESRIKGIAWSKEQWKNNRDYASKKASEYRERNKEKIRLRTKEHRLANIEKYNKWAKNRYLSNKHMFFHNNAIRRARKLRATPSWADLEKIKDIYRDRQLLSEMTGVLHHVDHIIPLQGKLVSGLHVGYNLRIIPASENLSKNNKLLEELL